MQNQKTSEITLTEKLQCLLDENKKLSAFKDKFELLVNNIEDFVWVMDKNIKLVYTSPSVFNALGYTLEEFLNTSVYKICSPKSVVKLKQAIANRLKGKSDNSQKQWEICFVHKNGNEVWFDIITTPVINESGEFEAVIGVSRNITDKKKIEKQNKEIQANLIAQIENTKDFIWSVDKSYKIKIINSNFKNEFFKTFGVELNIGSTITDHLPEPLKPKWKLRYNRALKGESFSVTDVFEIANKTQYVEVTFNPLIIDGTISGVSCFARDVTSQKLAEQTLKESEREVKEFVSSIPSVSYQCLSDKHGTMKFISNEIQNLTGFSSSDFIDNKIRSYASIIHPNDREKVKFEVNHRIEKREPFELQYRVIHKNSTIKWVQEWGRGSFNEKDELITINGVIVDITIQKKSEKKLIENEDRFKSLTDASVEMLGFSSRTETLKYISKILSNKLSDTIVIASKIDEPKQSLQFVSFEGLRKKDLLLHLNKKNIDPFETDCNLTNKSIELLKSTRIIEITHPRNLFSSGQISDKILSEVENLLNVTKIYVIGINQNNTLLGGIYFVTLNNKTISDTSFIKSFINLSSLVLQQQALVEALHFSEEKWKKIFDNSNSAISIQTASKILLVNKAWERITGYTAKDAKNLQPMQLVHPQDREQTMDMDKRRLMGENVPNNYLFHLIDKNANEKWIDLSTSLIDYEGTLATLVIGSDITIRKNAELEVNKLSTGIMNCPSSIIITDIDGKIEYVNPFFTEFTGYTLEDVKGKNPGILKSGNTPAEIYQDLWNTILKGEVWNGEFENRKKNGEAYWENARIAPIFNSDGIVIGFIAIKVDITEKIKSLGKIERSEKELKELNAKKDKFFSIIAHDLRSPFSALVGLTNILQNSFKEMSENELGNYLHLLNQSSENVFKLLENLLSWAKSQTDKMDFNPASLNIYDLAQETIVITQLSAQSKRVDIENEIPVNIRVKADKNMLLTIFRNLLSNALKYSHRNSRIKIGAKLEKENNNPVVKIWIQDFGIGIPKDKIHKIFKIEENYTTKGTEKEKGTGLGLILCKDFVEKHNGRIWCESEEENGTTFYFILPVS